MKQLTRYTQTQLKNLVNNGAAIDVSKGTNETRREIEAEEGYYRQIGYCSGVYGCSGMLLQGGKTGKLYAVIGRTQAIYIF